MNDFFKKYESDLNEEIKKFETRISHIHTGRANMSIIENIKVSAYGNKLPINHVATIKIPDATQILIQPWDKNLIKDIEKAILESGLNLNPQISGDFIRVIIPPLTRERREELVKLVKKYTEEARENIRRIRDNIRSEIKEKFENKEFSEDEKYKLLEELEEFIKEFMKKIDSIFSKKQNEIFSI